MTRNLFLKIIRNFSRETGKELLFDQNVSSFLIYLILSFRSWSRLSGLSFRCVKAPYLSTLGSAVLHHDINVRPWQSGKSFTRGGVRLFIEMSKSCLGIRNNDHASTVNIFINCLCMCKMSSNQGKSLKCVRVKE